MVEWSDHGFLSWIVCGNHGGVWDAFAALLPDVHIDDITLQLLVSERFPDQACIRNRIITKPRAWSAAFDSNLSLPDASATAIRAKLANDPDASRDLQRQWREAAAEALTATEDVRLAAELLAAVRSLQQGRIPRTQCFTDYSDGPGRYDCRRHIAGPEGQLTGGKLILAELTIRDPD